MCEMFHYNLQYLKTVYNVWNFSLQFTIFKNCLQCMKCFTTIYNIKTVYNVWNVPL